MAAPRAVDAAPLLAPLAAEVESREDAEDWEMEDWSKEHIVAQLRGLPKAACYSCGSHAAFLRFQEMAPGTVYEGVDLTVGLLAGVLGDGTVALLEFDLSRPSAVRWLRLALGDDSPPQHEGAPPAAKRQKTWMS
mmetsp:Transcript_102507/g.330771  ORF Transcript_102507/g.330771 Transcript_102507/m.330771 type:complete len:135 (-) Transcript_102507:66-470(-)